MEKFTQTIKRFLGRAEQSQPPKEERSLRNTPGTYFVMGITTYHSGGMREGYKIEAYGESNEGPFVNGEMIVNRFTIIPSAMGNKENIQVVVPENFLEPVTVYTPNGILLIDHTPYRTRQTVEISHYAGFGPSDQMERGERTIVFPSDVGRRS